MIILFESICKIAIDKKKLPQFLIHENVFNRWLKKRKELTGTLKQ